MHNAILIDPVARKITEVHVRKDDGYLADIYKHLECQLLDAVDVRNAGDVIYVDDEGLSVENQRYFGWRGHPEPLAGKGLLLGTDAVGEVISPNFDRAAVIEHVVWLSPIVIDGEVKYVATDATVTEH